VVCPLCVARVHCALPWATDGNGTGPSLRAPALYCSCAARYRIRCLLTLKARGGSVALTALRMCVLCLPCLRILCACVSCVPVCPLCLHVLCARVSCVSACACVSSVLACHVCLRVMCACVSCVPACLVCLHVLCACMSSVPGRLRVATPSSGGSGDGVGVDFASAAAWLGRAASEGDSSAQWMLGRLYYDGRVAPAPGTHRLVEAVKVCACGFRACVGVWVCGCLRVCVCGSFSACVRVCSRVCVCG
jgi:hypothetical protein